MTLQFDPSAYLQAWHAGQTNRPDASQIPNSINQGLQTLLDANRQKRADAMSQQQQDWKKQEHDAEWGVENPPTAATPQPMAPNPSAPSPMSFMGGDTWQNQGASPAPQQYDTPTGQAPPTGQTQSGLVAQFRDWQQNRKTPQAPTQDFSALGLNPQDSKLLGLDKFSRLGTKQIAAASDFLKARKEAEAKAGSQTMTTDQVIALQSGDPEKMRVAFPTGIPSSAASLFIKTGEQGDQFDQRDMTRLTTQLNNDHDLMNARQKINNVDTAMKNLDQMKTQPGGADQRQMVELAATTMRVLKNSGQITEGELRDLIPHTYKGDMNKFIERITNDPTGLDAGAFVERFQHTLERERTQAQGQLQSGFSRTVSTHQSTLSRNKDAAKNLYQSWGINHPDYNPAAAPPPGAGEVKRKTSDGRVAIFDTNSKKFIRWDGQ